MWLSQGKEIFFKWQTSPKLTSDIHTPPSTKKKTHHHHQKPLHLDKSLWSNRKYNILEEARGKTPYLQRNKGWIIDIFKSSSDNMQTRVKWNILVLRENNPPTYSSVLCELSFEGRRNTFSNKMEFVAKL